MNNITKLSAIESVLGNLSSFLSPALPFINSHNVDFFTEGHWDKLLPHKLREDLENMNPCNYVQIISSHLSSIVNSTWELSSNSKRGQEFNETNLEELFDSLYNLSLPSLKNGPGNIVVTQNQLLKGTRGDDESQSVDFLNLTPAELKFDPFMSEKKMHEVETLGHFIAQISQHIIEMNGDLTQINNLVDLGSGKGYISSYLALMYDFNVVAIDSSSTNTKGSQKRALRLQKTWAQLLRRAIERSKTGTCIRRGKHWYRKYQKEKRSQEKNSNSTPSEVNISNKIPISTLSFNNENIKDLQNSNSSDSLAQKLQNLTLFVTPQVDLNEIISKNISKNSSSSANQNQENAPNQTLPNQNDLNELSADHNHSNIRNPAKNVDTSLSSCQLLETDKNSFKNSVQSSINHNNEGNIPNEISADQNSSNNLENFGLVGLHTCGALGVDSLKIFLKTQNSAFLCNVPCCYHHLEEFEFPNTVSEINSPHSRNKAKKNNFWVSDDDESEKVLDLEPNFPLSRFLKEKEFNLGRNARMISSYSFNRILKELEESPELDKPLCWRLVLQVLIHKKLGNSITVEHNVGRIGSKCTDFRDYVRKALTKLHLTHLIISDEEINEIYNKYEDKLKYFQCYHLLKSVFAPLIEATILLDRLAFLLEKDVVKDAYIVQLFDQLLSPRCYAIFAIKDKK